MPPCRGRSRRWPAAACSSAARTARCTRSTRRRAASRGRLPRTEACARRSPSVRSAARARRSTLRAYADGTEAWGPAGGAIWSAPTIDAKRGAIYVGVGNTYSGPAQPTTDAIVAFDLKTGRMRWARQMTPKDVFGCTPGDINCADRPGPDFDFGASPALVTRADGRDLIVAGQKSGVVYALDPDKQGAPIWR